MFFLENSSFFFKNFKREMLKYKISPKVESLPRGPRTNVPINLLLEIVDVLGYKRVRKEKELVPEELDALEEICLENLGDNPYDWSYLIQAKYKNEELGKQIFQCFLPLLSPISKNGKFISGDEIIDAARVYENDPRYDLLVFGPFSAGDIFTVEDFSKRGHLTKKYAFLINTERGCGLHWVLFYVDTNNMKFEYFDSFGNYPNKNVTKTIKSITITLMDIIKNYHDFFGKKERTKITIHYSTNRLQYQGTECGVYCLWFLYKRIHGNNYKDFCNDEFPDRECEKLRNFFWNS